MNESIPAALKKLKEASRKLVRISEEDINACLKDLADAAIINTSRILEANAKDLVRMDKKDPKYDRLLLDEARIRGIAQDILKVSELPSPLNKILEERVLKNGLKLRKYSVPLGVLGIVYESRPNVTFDVFSLCLKSGNACVLKGSSDAHYSNICIAEIIRDVLDQHGIAQVVYLAPSERASLAGILGADEYIDAIIPRGGQGLINYVRENSRVPVIETGAGIVHTYIDASADIEKAREIVRNAKTRRVSVCNALDTLIIHEERLADLPNILRGLDNEFRLQLNADPKAYKVLEGHYENKLLMNARPESFGTEFLSMKMAVKTVGNMEDALDHIYTYSSRHSEAIIAEDEEVIERFLKEVDAAVVYANTSTAFTDGAQFEMGAEIGISTQKLHARGPMALRELTSYKWQVRGNGQVRIP